MKASARSWLFPLMITVIVAAFASVLLAMGRLPVCKCGIGLWEGSAWSSATSQHLADPYSFSHVLHGILFFGVLTLLWKRSTVKQRLFVALLLEMAWEVLENSPLIIERYRAATASLDYEGDSVLNSLGDLLCCMGGFWLAWKLPLKWTIATVIAIELIMLALIRDNLTLNIVMLIHPIEAIREWQIAGH
jgi:hypothetical protein